MITNTSKLQTCSPCSLGQLQWREGMATCVPCPAQGVDCGVRDAIDVLPGFYRPDDNDTTVARCPLRGACDGGVRGGNWSCSPGHAGPLCGACTAGYYRGRTNCNVCPQSTGAAVGTVVSIVLGGVALALGIFGYLHAMHPLRRRRKPSGRASG